MQYFLYLKLPPFAIVILLPLVDLGGACWAHAPPPPWDPILSFLHTVSPKSVRIRGPCPPNKCMPPHVKSWICHSPHCQYFTDETLQLTWHKILLKLPQETKNCLPVMCARPVWHSPMALGALSALSMLVLVVTSRFYVFSTSRC